MSIEISIQNVSKKYLIKHSSREKYKTLREALPAAAKNLGRRLFKGQPASDSSEEFWALRGVSFDVRQGDRVGIVGRNGAGKSTLLKILSRITEPTGGTIHIKGRVASLLEVGTGFNPELSGRENIFLNGAILGMTRREISQCFDAIVDFAEVEKFLDTPVKRYSSGMYMRLAFSVAAHLQSEILVVDEVLAVGDAQFQNKCLGKMNDLSESGRTVLFVTHNMDAMLALCNRGVVLSQGEVVFDGDAASARSEYLRFSSSIQASVEQNSGRGGSGGATIERVTIAATEASSQMVTGESLTVELQASVAEWLKTRRDIQVAFGLDSEDGTRCFTFLSSWADFHADAGSGRIDVRWIVDSLPLVPGRYLISATVLLHGDTLDSVQHCAEFRVLSRASNTHVERIQGWGCLDLPCKIMNV